MLQEGPRPCLILLDLMMPVMDGWALLEELRRDQDLESIPVTIVSAARYQGAFEPARFIKKPLSLEALVDMVKAICPRPPAV